MFADTVSNTVSNIVSNNDINPSINSDIKIDNVNDIENILKSMNIDSNQLLSNKLTENDKLEIDKITGIHFETDRNNMLLHKINDYRLQVDDHETTIGELLLPYESSLSPFTHTAVNTVFKYSDIRPISQRNFIKFLNDYDVLTKLITKGYLTSFSSMLLTQIHVLKLSEEDQLRASELVESYLSEIRNKMLKENITKTYMNNRLNSCLLDTKFIGTQYSSIRFKDDIIDSLKIPKDITTNPLLFIFYVNFTPSIAYAYILMFISS